MMPSFTFTYEAGTADESALICDGCRGIVCTIEEGDDFEIITRCAMDHADECPATGETPGRREGDA